MIKRLTLLTVLLTLSSSLVGAEPFFEKQSLFEAGKDGYVVYRIPGLVVTAQGTVLAYCEARLNGSKDWDTIDVMMRRSTDGGKTWSPRVKISDVPGPKTKNPLALSINGVSPDTVTYNNAVAFADAKGPVHFLYCLEYCRCFYIRSDDDGVTWTKPIEITKTFEAFRSAYDWKVLAVGPAHGIQLKKGEHAGRLVVPVWLSTGTGGNAHRPSVASTIYSDDSGKTWHAGEVAVPDTPEWVWPNETVIVELANGSVMLNTRSESKAHRRLVTVSRDGATKWSKPRFDDALVEPICMASIIRYSTMPESDKNRILFANPDNLEREDGTAAEGKSRDRKNLSLKMSYDEGKTWPVNKVLEPSYSAYSDLAVLPDGTILCLYEDGRASKSGKKSTSYAGLTLARFNLEWLTDGKDVPAAINGRSTYGATREDFQLDDFEAFVIHPTRPARNGAKPWVWYAPTIGHHPSIGNTWLLKQLLDRGFTVAGAYVGETFANPHSREQFATFYDYVTKQYGLDPQVCLLAQSRGGLNLYNFAADHPERVRCLAGIFPVGDLRSFPTLKRAAPAYGMTPEELEAQLARHNPIERLAPIAAAKIPVLHIHGDADKTVPIEKNSRVVFERYKQLGGPMELIVVPGKGHENAKEFFESQAMLDFLSKEGLGETSVDGGPGTIAPLPTMSKVNINGIEVSAVDPPKGLMLRPRLGLLTVDALDGDVIHRTNTRILECRGTITPGGDYLVMFPEGDHYAKSKGEKMNQLIAYRSTDKGKTWTGPTVAYDIPYSQHGFIPFIPRGSKRLYAFGTQPIPGKWTWENGQQENASIGYRHSDDDGRTWSDVTLIEPANDPGFRGMSVMRMTETDAGTWLVGSHIADWSVKPIKTKQYLLRSPDQGKTWNVLPGPRPNGWFAAGFDRMDEGRPLNLGGGRVLFMTRTPQGHLFTAWSNDDGQTWTEPAPSTLVHPDAPPMLFPLSDGKTLVAFHHNKVPRRGNGDLDEKAENMRVRSEIWAATSTDGGHTWSEPRFVLANAAKPNLTVGAWNYQCSYLDAFIDDGVMHLFMPHRWQQVLHLTIAETALAKLPTKSELQAMAGAR